MTDHAPYISAVAQHLGEAGFHVLTTTADGGKPRTGWITLARQDGWRDSRWYGGDMADVLWHEVLGWRMKRAGVEVPLQICSLATPAVVATTVGHWVGQEPVPVLGAVSDEPHVKAGTPEFDLVLARYRDR